MAKRDPEKTRRLRTAVRYLVEQGNLVKGNQATLARHFHVSRQRVHQIVREERERVSEYAAPEGA
jgi:predicted XRE-type DNA-binding protein